MRAAAGAAAVLLVSLASGCADRYLRYGVSTVIERDCPEPREHIIGRFGADVAVGGAWAGPLRSTVAGVMFYPDAHHEHIWAAYAGVDVLRGIHSMTAGVPARGKGLFPTLTIMAGMWAWVESPSNCGPMTGLKAGLGAVVRDGSPRTSVVLEFEEIFLHDFLEARSASIQTVGLKVEWRF